jgi:hypothetical protein
VKDLDKPTSVLIGLAAGVPVAMIVEKAIGKQATVSGLLGIDGKKLTRILKPAVNIALGMSIHQLASNPKIKLAGIGLAANGGLIAVKDFLGKDILRGPGDSDIGALASRQPARVIEQAIQTTPLNLPVIEIDDPKEVDRYIEPDIDGEELSTRGRNNEIEEILLSSERPEDNFKTNSEEDVAGDLELVVNEPLKAQIPQTRLYPDLDDDMDFTEIP